MEPDGNVDRTPPTYSGTAVLGAAHDAVYGEAGKFCTVATQEAGGWAVTVLRPSFDIYKVASSPDAFDTAVYGNVERVLGQQLQGTGAFRAILQTDKKMLLAVEGKTLKWARGTID